VDYNKFYIKKFLGAHFEHEKNTAADDQVLYPGDFPTVASTLSFLSVLFPV
jgi:hypothetical protein